MTDQTPGTGDGALDLGVIEAQWLQVCGYCDAGIGECSHRADDYRPTMLRLVREVDALRQSLTEAEASHQAEKGRLRAELDEAGEQKTMAELLADQMARLADAANGRTRTAEAERDRLREERDDYRARLKAGNDAYRRQCEKLCAAEAERDTLTARLAAIEALVPADWEPYIEPPEQRVVAYVRGAIDDAANQRGKQTELVARLAEAEKVVERVLGRHATIGTLCEADEYELRRWYDKSTRAETTDD